MDQEIELIAEYAKRLLPLSSARLGDEYFYQSIPLCVIDAVYSIGVRYTGVQAVVARYCEKFRLPKVRKNRKHLPRKDEQESITAFYQKIEKIGAESMATKVFCNRQRTSTRSGILKADAVQRFARVLLEHKVEYFQDISRAADDESLEKSILSIPGQGSGVSLRYFWMLAGSDEFIKPDRMVLRFLESALSRPVSVHEAQNLLSGACDLLKKDHPNLTPRLLDHEVWKHQRDKPVS
jgi:hypothetical protein